VVFRHQQNASMNGGEDVASGDRSAKLGAFYAYRNTFNEESIWVEVPKKGRICEKLEVALSFPDSKLTPERQ
jgi:hypothetical protein